MTGQEYQQLQNRLQKKLEYCNGLTGKQQEGFRQGIKIAISILSNFYNSCVEKLTMAENEYQDIQNQLRKQLSAYKGLSYRYKEGLEQGVKSAMSMLHDLYKPYNIEN